MKIRNSLLIVLILFSTELYAQVTIETLSQEAAENIYKQLKKADIAPQSKMAILYFEGQTGSSNSIKSLLGIRISNKVATYLAKKINTKKYTILMPENTQEKKYFSPPTTAAEQEDFYRNFNENQRPDYFIFGKYHISLDYSTITLSDIVMKENQYKLNSTNKSLGFESYTTSILSSDEEEIKTLNIEYGESEDFMSKILQFWGSNDDLFSFSVLDVETNNTIEENDKLLIGKSYSLKVEVKKSCYLYAFLYIPEDKEHPYLTPLYPYKNEKSKLFEKGIYYLPHKGGFNIEPPIGNTYIKVIASIKPLALQITYIKDKNGYMITSINQQDAEIFFTNLKSSQKLKIPITVQLKTFKIEYK